jgi:DNA-binding protein HU-beta
MNKTDLVEKIAAAHGVSKTAAGGAIDTIIDTVTTTLKKGGRVTLVGFGTFSVYQRKPRNGRNPQTGGVIKIAGRRAAKFSPGLELRKAVAKK